MDTKLTEEKAKLLSDDELVKLAKKGSDVAMTALIIKYRPLINKLTRKYFFCRGIDNDDLLQEGSLALIKAIKNHDVEKNNSFMTFAYQCIENRLRDILRASNSINNKAYNETVSIIEEDGTVTERIADVHVIDPLAQALKDEMKENLYTLAKENLPKKQYNVLVLFLEGFSYAEIVEKLGLNNTKQVDNALAAAKRTLRDLLNE